MMSPKVVCDPTVEVAAGLICVWFGGRDVASPDEKLHGKPAVVRTILVTTIIGRTAYSPLTPCPHLDMAGIGPLHWSQPRHLLPQFYLYTPTTRPTTTSHRVHPCKRTELIGAPVEHSL